jgi:hypothetical protein
VWGVLERCLVSIGSPRPLLGCPLPSLHPLWGGVGRGGGRCAWAGGRLSALYFVVFLCLFVCIIIGFLWGFAFRFKSFNFWLGSLWGRKSLYVMSLGRSCLHGVGVFLQKWFSQSCLFEMMKIFHFWKADPNEFKFGRYPDSAGFGSVYMVWACVCVRVCVCGKSGFLDGVAFFG